MEQKCEELKKNIHRETSGDELEDGNKSQGE